MRPVGLLVPLLLDVMLFGCAWGVVDLTTPDLEAEPAVIRGGISGLWQWSCSIGIESRKPHSRGDGESNVQDEQVVASKIIVDPGFRHFTVWCDDSRYFALTTCYWVSSFSISLESGHDYKASADIVLANSNTLRIRDTTTGNIVAEKSVYRTCSKSPFRDYSAASSDDEEPESQSSGPLTPPY